MTFIENIANYALGNVEVRLLPEIAIAAMLEGIDTPSLVMLAGMSNDNNLFEIESYFFRTLKEQNIKLPTVEEASNTLLLFKLKEIVAEKVSGYDGMNFIDNNIYKCSIFWSSEKRKNERFVGESLDLGGMFCWYRELQDFNDNSRLLYFNDLPRDKQKQMFEKQLYLEADLLLKKMKNQL